MLYTHIHADVSRNIMTTSMNETNTLLYKKNTSHTLFKRVDVGCVWEVSWRRGQTATYWPQVPLTIAALLLHSGWAAQLGSLRAQAVCLELVLTLRASYLQLQLQLELQLTQAVSGTWLYNCLTPTCFLWAYASAPNSTMSTGQDDMPISLTGCTCFCPSAYLHWCISWLTAQSRANMLHKYFEMKC